MGGFGGEVRGSGGGGGVRVSDRAPQPVFPNTIWIMAGTGRQLGRDREGVPLESTLGGRFGEHFGEVWGSLWRALWGGFGVALESTLVM